MIVFGEVAMCIVSPYGYAALLGRLPVFLNGALLIAVAYRAPFGEPLGRVLLLFGVVWTVIGVLALGHAIASPGPARSGRRRDSHVR